MKRVNLSTIAALLTIIVLLPFMSSCGDDKDEPTWDFYIQFSMNSNLADAEGNLLQNALWQEFLAANKQIPSSGILRLGSLTPDAARSAFESTYNSYYEAYHKAYQDGSFSNWPEGGWLQLILKFYGDGYGSSETRVITVSKDGVEDR